MPGAVGLQRAIAEQTGGGLKMVARMVAMIDSDSEPMAAQACTWLANRLWGKPKESVEVTEVHRQLRIIIDARAPTDDQAQPAQLTDHW